MDLQTGASFDVIPNIKFAALRFCSSYVRFNVHIKVAGCSAPAPRPRRPFAAPKGLLGSSKRGRSSSTRILSAYPFWGTSPAPRASVDSLLVHSHDGSKEPQ